MPTMLSSRSEASDTKGVQIRDRAAQNSMRKPAMPPGDRRIWRSRPADSLDPPSRAAARARSTTARGARTTTARRAKSAATGVAKNKSANPRRRRTEAASAEGFARVEEVRAMSLWDVSLGQQAGLNASMVQKLSGRDP